MRTRPARRVFSALLFALALTAACLPPARAQTAPPAAATERKLPDPARFEKDIRKFEDEDRAARIAPGAVVFYGSSSIVRWKTLREDFPGVPTLNRGFGGSNIPEAIYYAKRVVVPRQPSAVVFYGGDNDLAQGQTPAEVRDTFAAFVKTLRDAGLRDTPILFVAVKPSIARWKLRDKITEANRLVREWSAAQPGGKVVFVDIYPAMLGPDGQPRPELYVKDGLHMTPAGYALWTAAVRPALEAALGVRSEESGARGKKVRRR
jgi:lysophospholipase L1-like esterase